jgi:cell division protein FtsI/penicillin-binding protein 2
VPSVRRRIGALFGVFFLLLVLAALRAFYIGVLQGATLRRDAQAEQLTYEEVPAPRGTITDDSGFDLAVSEPADEVSATPYLVAERGPAASRLAPLLGQPRAQVLAKLRQSSGFVYLDRALPAARTQAILALHIPGIQATPVMRRVYPGQQLAGQLLGLVGTDGNGLAGLEYSSNALLSGHRGRRRVVSDARGQPVSIETVHNTVPGNSMQLTIDANIQQRAEDVLGAVGRVYKPKDATAIVMNPDDGSVLAMASWPSLNPNHPPASSQAAEAALENRAVAFNYEPGSTFKVVTVSGALQSGTITPSSSFNIPDQIQVANRVIHDDVEHPEETLTAGQILAQSSNVGAITIAGLLGPNGFNNWVRRYGFGAPTGIELPGEEQGKVLQPSEYSGSSMGNLPIGQGELVTPIQMATAYAAIANGGILRRPHIVAAIDHRRTKEPPGHRVISEHTAAEVRSMLRGVLAPGGTASEVSIPGYELAGKTGTANKVDPATGQYSETAYVASFIGFVPASNPKLVCAVVVDEPTAGSIYGGKVAAPAWGEIMSFALQYLGIPPSA